MGRCAESSVMGGRAGGRAGECPFRAPFASVNDHDPDKQPGARVGTASMSPIITIMQHTM